MELALLLVILAAWDSVKSGIRHSGQTRRKGSAAKVKAAEKAAAPGTLSPARKRAIKASHDAGWWGGEILGGFPVHRTGWHAGRLAHKAAADSQRAVREEARTTHLERRASVLSELPEHRKRQQEARDQIIAASADPETGKAKSRQAVQEAADEVARKRAERQQTAERSGNLSDPDVARELPAQPKPEPGPYAGRRDSDWLNPAEPRCPDCDGAGCAVCGGWGNAPWDPSSPGAPEGSICAACGNPASADDPVQRQPNGYPVHRSHAIEAQRIQKERREQQEAAQMSSDAARNPEPIPPSLSTEGAPVSDTTFTSVIADARAGLAQSDQDTAEIRTRKDAAYATADQMAAAGADPSVISAQMDYADALAAAEQKLAEAGEHAGNTAATAERMHGGMQAAHDDAPGKVATREFHGGN